MVDNENQWEDMEYSDEAGASDNYSEEGYEDYPEQDYESYDDDSAVEEQKPSSSANGCGCIILLLLLALLIAGVVFFVMPKIKGKDSSAPDNKVEIQQEQTTTVDFGTEEGISVSETSQEPMQEQSTAEVADMFFNEAGGNESTEMMSVDFNEAGETQVTTSNGEEEIVATVTETPVEPKKEEQVVETEESLFSQEDLTGDSTQGSNEIMVSYNKSTRANPFKPPVVSKDESDTYTLINNTQFEIIEPPVESVADENLTRLLQTQISGILYDEVSPSAIVNLNGVDQFVKIGDSVAGYKIESITKDKVQINYKNNSYVASVGELFTRGALEKAPAVVGLENKFAGRYKNK